MIVSKWAAASSAVSANFTAPAFMRPPESTWLFSTTGAADLGGGRARLGRALHDPALAERQAVPRKSALDSYS